MTCIAFTDKSIQSIKAAKSRKEYPDATVAGLYLIVQPSGLKSWAVRYRYNEKSVKQTIGSYPLISLKVARDEARRIRLAVSDGFDPKTVLNEDDYDFDVIWNLFLDRYVKVRNKASTVKAIKSMAATSILPVFTGKDIRNVARRDIIKLLDDMVSRGVPVQANRVLTLLKTFFKWCIEREYIEGSPADNIQKPSAETSRDRVLSEDELKLIWRAAERIGFPYGTITKALMLSGQRRTEVGGASYAEFTSDESGPLWIIPRERVKNGREHIVPMPPLLASVFNSAPKIAGDGDFIFTNDGERAVNAYGDGKKLIDAAMVAILREDALKASDDPDLIDEVPHWTFHDLRRTVASGLALLKVNPHIIEAVINHASGTVSGVAAIYNRYSYQAEKRAALALWETTIRRVCLGERNVVPLFQQAAG